MDLVGLVKDFSTDVKIILNDQDRDTTIRDVRVCSVALRAFGALGAFLLAKMFVTTVLFGINPVTSTALLALSAIGFVFSRDLVQVGINQSNAIKGYTPISENIGIGQRLKGIYHTTKAAGQAALGIDYLLQDTWILKHIF